MKRFCLALFFAFSTVAGAQSVEVLHEWPQAGIAGAPAGDLLVNGADVMGVTNYGGSSDVGYIFKLTGGTLTKLRDFDASGAAPFGGLTLGSDGNYYGTTFVGGLGSLFGFPRTGNGTIFRMTPAGAYSTLFNFSTTANPVGTLVEISPLVFAGMTQHVVSSSSGGTVFKFDANVGGTGFTVLKSFNANNDGRGSVGLIKASDGKLYGTTTRVIFKMDVDGANYTVLRSVTSSSDPLGFGFTYGVTEGADGRLYGMAHMGGDNGKGVVFRLDKDGANYTVLHHFNGTDGTGTQSNAVKARLLAHSDGNIYGATRNGGASDYGALFRVAQDGTFTKLRDFPIGGPSGLTENAGKLLLTVNNADNRGAIHEVTTAGALTTLYGFSDVLGAKPVGAPLLAADGHIYGTTAEGGGEDGGTFWRKRSTGEFEVLASFRNDAALPDSGLIEASDGAFYFTSARSFVSPSGTLLKATTNGVITEVGSIGSRSGGVVEGPDGALYAVRDDGRFIRMTKAGELSILRTFSGTAGTGGYGPPVLGDDGAFYGTTTGGGANGRGTFWKFEGTTASGTFTVLRSFQASESVGGPLVKGRDGALNGLLNFNGIATHYRMTTAGTFTALAATTDYATQGEPIPVALVERNLGKFYIPHFIGPGASGTVRKIFEFGGGNAGPFITLAPSPATSATYSIAQGSLAGGISRGTDRNLYGVLPDGASSLGSLYRIVMPASSDPLPSAATLAATNVQSLSATLNGEVTPNGTPVVVFFEYGATTAYGKRTPGVLIQPGAAATIAVSAEATGLVRNAEFHFRLVAENDGGTSVGADQSATTTSNSAPRAVTDTVPIRAKEVLTIAVLANDSDPDGDAFTMDSFTQGAKGVVTRVGNNLVYTPGKAFAGSDSFTYQLSDSLGATSTGQVFVQNPFLILGGSYSPIIGDDDGVMTLKLSSAGVLTGKAKVLGKTFTIKGVVGLDGPFTQRFKRNGLADLVVTLNFTNPGQIPTVSGTVAGGPAEQFPVSADSRLATTLPASAPAGKYTLVLEPGAGVPAALDAFGWAVGTLSPNGSMVMIGQTPDGKPLSLSAKMRVDASVVIFKTAPAPASSFVGEFAFADAAQSDFSGSMKWTRAAVTKGSIFTGAIDTTLGIKGCKFTPTAKNIRTLSYTNSAAATGQLLLEDGELAASITRTFAISTTDKATLAPGETSPEVLKISLISRGDGRFEGTFKHPVLLKNPTIKFRGVQLQTVVGGTGPNKAFGLFTTPADAGSFTYTPQ
ncbi:MAG: hypothetical protein RL088_296 [Verrucomicrobiota bacterium]|jgi:uncharacterized repeat protein (TIGR03803 family)